QFEATDGHPIDPCRGGGRDLVGETQGDRLGCAAPVSRHGASDPGPGQVAADDTCGDGVQQVELHLVEKAPGYVTDTCTDHEAGQFTGAASRCMAHVVPPLQRLLLSAMM